MVNFKGVSNSKISRSISKIFYKEEGARPGDPLDPCLNLSAMFCRVQVSKMEENVEKPNLMEPNLSFTLRNKGFLENC
jgi:hypothetical protein